MRSQLTAEYAAACSAKAASAALDALAGKLRDVGTPEAKQHAKEAAGAAKTARAWRRELERQHRAKMREPANVGVEAPLTALRKDEDGPD